MSGAAYFPFRPRCAHWAAARCQAQAVAHMTNPDGERVPGCWYCWEHGAATLGEYAVKLGEQWGAVQIETGAERTLQDFFDDRASARWERRRDERSER